MMEKQSQTTAGRLSTLKDEYNEMNVALGEKFKPAIDGAISMLSSLTGSIRKWAQIPMSEKIKQQADSLRVLKTELMDTNIAEDRRKEILSEINSNYGEYLKGLNLEKASYQEINSALETTITLLDKKSQKSRLNEILKDAQDEVNNLYKSRTSAVNYIYKQYGSRFPDIMNKEGLTSEQRIDMIRKRMQGSTMGNVTGAPSQFQGEDAFWVNNFFDINKNIGKAKQKLKETSADVQRQMKDEGLYDVKLDDEEGKGGKGNGSSSSSTTTGSAGSGSSSNASISGGSKITHLTINIDSLIKGFNVHSTTLKEGTAQVKDAVIETLLTAVNDANLAVGN